VVGQWPTIRDERERTFDGDRVVVGSEMGQDSICRAREVLRAHLDRSIQTGLKCSYTSVGGEALIDWVVEG